MQYYFITGTSKGIGRALCQELLKEARKKVIGVARSAGINHDAYKHFQFDLSDISQISGFADRFFNIDEVPEKIVLINNAGILGDVAALGAKNNDNLVKQFAVNVIAPAVLMNSFINKFSDTNAKKSIINISSGAASKPYDGWAGYCASKAALNMLSEVAALESKIKNLGFKIFALAPGVVDTEMQEELRKTDKEKFSNIERFLSLKKNNELSNANDAAKKILQFIEMRDDYAEAIYDIRRL